MTEIELAKNGIISDNVKKIAVREGVDPELISQDIAKGHTVILKNNTHNVEPVAVGKSLATKVNANIGTSSDISDIDLEIKKAIVAIKAGADTIMDLSTGGDLDLARRKIMKAANVVIGTVPIYQAASEIAESEGTIDLMSEDLLFDVIERHLESGVDYLTIHCGVTWHTIDTERTSERIQGVVSKGGSLLAKWMIANKRENPLYENFDRLLELTKRYDATLSLGDAFRPGAIDDASDRCQIEELITLGRLHNRALDYGVQSMIEGPGHIPIDHILPNLKMEKSLCDGAPFYVLGPLVTDIAPGYDHI
ncbi:MAG TPA: phosphomethylpyrimidine synthase ThiC, partial [Deltaproteobacteria bacterium]|nr:phosphomethylpyrimidine synthase ThiC [Deltaproteobacteria bacterium]